MKTTRYLYAPAFLSMILAASAMTAAAVIKSLDGLGLVSNNDYGFAKTEHGLQLTLNGEDIHQKLAGTAKMSTVDISSENDLGFFEVDRDGRFTATISYDAVTKMLDGKKKLTEARWRKIVDQLVQTAKVASMPAPATHSRTGARAAA